MPTITVTILIRANVEFVTFTTGTVEVIRGGEARKPAGQVQITRVVAGEVKTTGIGA